MLSLSVFMLFAMFMIMHKIAMRTFHQFKHVTFSNELCKVVCRGNRA